MIKKDVLIIGSGIAGLSFALKIAKARPDLSVCLITKSSKAETNTRYAQGGIAVVLDKLTDSYQQHIDDTLKSGGGLCNKKVVEMVVKKAPERLNELLEWGVEFDKDPDGEFSAGLEGGHSQPRILHHKDFTGFEIEKKLLLHIQQYPNISIVSHYFALDLITGPSNNSNIKTCYGAYVLNEKDNTIKTFRAKVTLLATGGSGQVYETTTNPLVATGDGVAMAQRANAKISEMQFIQFHPTAFYDKNTSPSFLISEAVRGFGAYLVNSEGLRFVYEYDIRGELATRDIVSKAIYCELWKSGKENVFIDCRHLNIKDFINHFPGIYNHCIKNGIDVSKDLIPVAPAAHYQCGGITVDSHSETSIANLYACGECSCTGLHGLNRLASNSLLEAIVFSNEAAIQILNTIDTIKYEPQLTSFSFANKKADSEKINSYKNEIKEVVTTHAGILKSTAGLITAQNQLAKLETKVNEEFKECAPQKDFWEMKNMLAVAQLIVNQSLNYNSIPQINSKKQILHTI